MWGKYRGKRPRTTEGQGSHLSTERSEVLTPDNLLDSNTKDVIPKTRRSSAGRGISRVLPHT